MKVVRYTTKPECAQENVALVEAVFAALAATGPADFAYASYRLDDGVTFVHVVDDRGDNPLLGLPEFRAFNAGIADRCVNGPVVSDATTVGSYTSR